MILFTLIPLLALFQQVNSAGFLDIHLKSIYNQKATVTLSEEDGTTYLVLPIILKKDEEMKFEDILINFNKTYNIGISIDETGELGLSKSLYKGVITPAPGTSSPKKVNLPLNGIRFDFKCEPNYYGEKCDVLCDLKEECPTNKTAVDLELDVDYTVNPQKLETIVKMLKKDNEIANTFAAEKLDNFAMEEIMESSGQSL
uniref:Secreted protein n=1 Tax=Caenorhabditis tropicalis TaxID=1561998 RepID=A0A1I7TPW8_9PELO